ncbi:hypothetical protein ABFA07_004566 [Porites harrisoni]
MYTVLEVYVCLVVLNLCCILHVMCHTVNAEFKLPRSCRWNQMSVLKPTGTECFNCPECPAGQGLVPQCGSRITADVSVECVHCQTGENYSYKRDISSCKPCTICDPNEQTISLCTASKNAVCGKCKSGYYRAVTGDCHPCSWCCICSKEADKEQQCIEQTNLPVNQVCRYDVNTIKCKPRRNSTTAYASATSAVIKPTGSEGLFGYGTDDEKGKNGVLLVLICVSVVLAVSIVIGFLYVSHRKTQFLFHSGWEKSFVESHGIQENIVSIPPLSVVLERKPDA